MASRVILTMRISAVIFFITFFILDLLALQYSSTVLAECRNCNQLDSSKYFGIKNTKQYINKKGVIKKFKNESKAKRAGYTKFTSCNSTQQDIKQRSKSCQPAYGIKSDKLYLCPKELRGFTNEEKARSKGYSEYTSCNQPIATPTATATPAVPPIQSTRSFLLDNGTRISDIASFTILMKQDSSFVAYTSSSIDSLENLKYSNSADGLTFSQPASIAGITPDVSRTFANPTALLLPSGSTILLYESINNAVTGGVFVSSVLRAESLDGLNFAQIPDSVTLPQGAGVSLIFEPALLRITDSTIRAYYTYSQSILTATSVDNGVNWTAEGEVVILGRSNNYAPFVSSVSVIKVTDNSYLMFFSSIPDINSDKSAIYSAESTDGQVFTVHDTPVLTPPNGNSYAAPEAIILQNGKIRLYIIEYSDSLGNVTKNLLSALEQ